MMHWYGAGIGGWSFALMTVTMLLFWGLILAGVVLLVRCVGGAGRPGHAGPAAQTPERILAERLARGEIDEEEYQRRLTVLAGAPRP